MADTPETPPTKRAKKATPAEPTKGATAATREVTPTAPIKTAATKPGNGAAGSTDRAFEGAGGKSRPHRGRQAEQR